MRVLHLIHSEGIYGAELILAYLARETQRMGHNAIVGSIQDPGTGETPFEAFAASWGIEVLPIRIAPRPTPGVIRSLLRSIRSVQPDVLHSHGYKADILLGLLPRSARGPMVTTLHGWTVTRPFTALWLYERLDRLSLRGIDRVVVVARHMSHLPAVRAVGSPRLRVIENGIPPLETRLADNAARGVGALPAELVEFVARRPTLVAIGRLSTEKGFDLLMDAFAAARASGSPYQLLIVGEGPDRGLLEERVARLQLSEIVRLPGYLPGADRLLERARGFVMSSLTEGLPLVLLEAMQWRVPVLATAVGAIPALLQDGRLGALVPPGSRAGLETALRRMMAADFDSGQAVAAAHEAVTSRYTSARMAQEYLETYREAREA